MFYSKSSKRYHNAYTMLAAEILSSGIQDNDSIFLNSEWAQVLRDMCMLDDEMYGARSSGTRGVIHGDSKHKGVYNE